MLPHRTDHPIVPLDSRRAWECPWYSVRQDRIALPDGGEGVYNVVELPDAVWVVPVTAEGQRWRRRHPWPRVWGWPIPGGVTDRRAAGAAIG